MRPVELELDEDTIVSARKSIHKLVDNLIELKLDEIESYQFPLDQPFGLEIKHKGALFYLILKLASDNKNLICFVPGAFRRDRVNSKGELIEPPHFSRATWYKYFDESVITCADPMIFLDDEIKVGWMIGEKDHWYLETLSVIIQKIAKNQNVINDNIMFYGSSGGGFVSICLATLIKNSKVAVNNAQFSLEKYWKNTFHKAIDVVAPTFEGMTRDEIIKKISYRLNIIELFERENYAPYLTYYANVKSEKDITVHSISLIQDHYKQNQFQGLNIIYYSEDSKPTPHHPINRQASLKIIELYAKNNLYNIKPETAKKLIPEEKYSENLLNENKKLKKEIKTLKNSRSWKITQPLRKIKELFE